MSTFFEFTHFSLRLLTDIFANLKLIFMILILFELLIVESSSINSFNSNIVDVKLEIKLIFSGTNKQNCMKIHKEQNVLNNFISYPLYVLIFFCE